jgi:3-hydroxyacyl-[acyl-carrier-protein] dehydratase
MTAFFSYSKPQMEDDLLHCEISILSDHPVFQGHFPDFPVLPGALFMAMAKVVLEAHLQIKLQLQKAGEIKFLTALPMHQNQQITLTIQVFSTDNLRVKAIFKKGEKMLCKMDASYEVKLH